MRDRLDRELRSDLCLCLIQQRLLSVGDGEMRDDRVELPVVWWVVGIAPRDRLGEPNERLRGFWRHIERAWKAP